MIKSLSPKNTTHLLPLALLLVLRTRNNTDSNKLIIFSGIALYYGDTYIIILLILFIYFCVQGKAERELIKSDA